MDILETLGPFWIIGIVLNVTLTGLAITWVVRSMRSGKARSNAPVDPAGRS